MTRSGLVDKDRKVYCSQCHDDARLQCIICRLDTISRNCRIYKNPASLWWHIRRHHRKFVCADFDVKDVLRVLNEITFEMTGAGTR